MFNNYSKFVTAFAAFALLFSTGAWSQCAEGEIAVDYSVGGGSYDSEISWSLNDETGNPVVFADGSTATGGAPISGQWCLAAGDYTFLGLDSYGDGWNGATATFTSGGVVIGSLAVEGSSGSVIFTVSADVPGCTDATASNYNAAATVDDGTCCFNDLVTITLYDSFGDGMNWLGAEGGLLFAGVYYPFLDGASMSMDFCLAPGCYSGTLTLDQYASETSWDVVANGAVVATGSGASTDLFFSTDPACIVAGCNDENSCNYDAAANVNDGSCDYISCAGCVDPTACNYDDTATLADTSCDYSCIGCMDATATNYDADATIMCEDCCAYCEGAFAGTLTVGGGTWDSEIGYTLSLGDVVVSEGGAGSESLCLEAGCYTFNMTDSYGDGWNGGVYSFDGYDGVNVYTGDINNAASGDGTSEGTDYLDFNGGTCTSGCTDAGSCNYDASASFEDGSCDYSCVGCMDSSAANYDPNATVDSGLCVYCDPGSFVLTLNMSDSFGDGWNGAVYYVYDQVSGELMLSGDLDTAFSGDGLSSGADLVCLSPGCYSVQVSAGASPTEVSVSMSDQFGTNYGSTGGDSVYPLDFTLTGACGFEGCTSASALNYNPSATIDDGSCQEPPANDLLANAEALTCGSFADGTLLFSTDDQNLIDSEFAGNAVVTSGVWYVLNAAYDQQVTVSTCDTPTNATDGSTDYTNDTKIFVYTVALDGSLTAMASNDDGCGTGFLSSATFNVVTGTDYYISISEYSAFTNGNDFVVSVTCADCENVPTNDECEDAIATVNGVTFTGSTCCASQEGLDIPWAGFSTAYGVWFTFNSEEFDTFNFDATNLTNEGIGLGFMGSGDCADLAAVAGCSFTGTCAGSVEAFIDLEPNTEYYAVIWTTDLNTCGDFEFTTTGVNFGCTDVTATNYDATATTDDGTCDFTDVVPPNDSCDGAIALTCNTVTTGSTGGSTILGSPIGVAGCETAPGAGVWYSFVGDGQLHNLSTCGSDIDSKINIYTADVACGGGGIDVPPADACGEGLVTVNISVGGGAWDSEISWSLDDAAATSGAAPSTGSVCLAEGDYTFTMNDAYGDGWNGANATFTNGLGEVIGFFTLDAGAVGTATLSVAAYSMEPVYQPGDFTCFASAVSSDGTGTCTLFDDNDVNFEFVSTVGTLYYVLVGSEGSAGAFDLVFDCAAVVEGCMNTAACNYDPLANVSTDTCDFWSCVCATETGTAIQLNMVDAFGDGWNDAGYTISDLAGNLLFEGSLDDAQYSVDNDNYAGPENGFDMLCLEPGCYNISVTPGDWGSEVSWDISLEDGTVLVAGGAPDSQTISVGGAVCGCTDDGACNYDELATDDDGSCEYETCAGCTDMSSCSYNADATIDDGSCCYSNCVDVQMFDSFGDGWNGAVYVISTVDGTEVGTGTIDLGSSATDSYCLADGCYTISVGGGTYDSEITWTLLGAFGGLVSGAAPDSATFNVGTGDQCIVGCDISCACNYDSAVNISDVEQCVFSGCEGCTYPDASNYDAAAISDDGSCTFDIANPCPADLNGDGSITTGDLLIFLGAFGTICE